MIRKVELRGVVKIRGATAVLKGVQGSFEGGTTVTIEGANGTGKSTLLSLLAGLSKPNRGFISIEMAQSQRRARIGFVDHEVLLYPDLSTVENLSFFATLHGENTQRVEETLRDLELGNFAELPIRRCSRGQKQKAALARALLHKPDILLLDEPDTGLDKKNRKELLAILERERARGCLLVMVTHDSSFAEDAATERFVLEGGLLKSAG